MNKSNQKRKTTSDKNPLIKEDTLKSFKKMSDRSIKGLFLAGAVASVLLIAGIFFFHPFNAQAQGRFGSPKSADQIVERLTDRLELTEDQEETIRPIIEEKVQKMNEIREKYGTDRRAAGTEMQRLRWDTEMKLNETLTGEQVDKYLGLKQEQRENMQRGIFGNKKMRGQFTKTPAQKIERLSTLLDLTDEQTVQIEPIIKESIAKQQLVRQAMRDEMQAIGDETHDQLLTILTDEQMDELNLLREQRRARMDRRMDRPGYMGF